MKTLIIFLLLFSITYLSYSQKITGNVADVQNNLTLVGAAVYIEKTDFATITDIDGFFSLKLKPGVYILTITYIDYSDFSKKIEIIENEDYNIGKIFLEKKTKNTYNRTK